MAVLSKRIEQLVPINRYAKIISHVFRRATTVSKHVNWPYSPWVGTGTKLCLFEAKLLCFTNEIFI